MEIADITTSESSGLISVKSVLSMKVMKENKDDSFYCEATFFTPGETRMTESDRVNITVLCEFTVSDRCSQQLLPPKVEAIWMKIAINISYKTRKYLLLISFSHIIEFQLFSSG